MLLRLANITKSFPGVLANDHITLDVRKGEIHAIVGENGAGKTTLMNILYGLYQPDEGEIFFKDQLVQFSSPREAIACGIGMVHQHFMLIPTFTVTENVILGAKPTDKSQGQSRSHHLKQQFLLDIKQAEQEITALSERFGLAVNPRAMVSDLAVGVRQRVEIIKALYRQAELLILDEPTSVLTPQETRDFFRILKTLVQEGMSVIFITHKLHEVIESSDRATVLRGGKVVQTVDVAGVTRRDLAQMMVGRGVLERLDKTPRKPGPERLRVEQVSYVSPEKITLLDKVSFTLHAGEILGIAGVSGNGQSELGEILAGLRAASHGKIMVNGRDVTQLSPRRIMGAGLSHIPEERQAMGLVMDFPLADNAILGSFFHPPFSHHAFLDKGQTSTYTRNLLVTYDIKTKDVTVEVHELSGGNQQKFVVGRELQRTPQILLAVQPTRGVDIGSTEFIHQRLLEQRDQGVAILLISTEMDEIFTLSDRIGVMYKGQLVGIVPTEEADRETIGLMMAGAS
ncbi:ATP-binding cassette domain-containing protein [candidate division KSB3 bacterium]|uniref:ATP-binding cassette domain-containing protein n=1 Tax=candidate division KSB3 bacterium TaxID=2044937 RepID=A0A9D5JVF1_9BACT|nr:ATP-binding cassette domain-containing protein [candidate division KSB3 bacterium]MBD3324984.1 ATP-binding cassette domain-containing protein [candidate division KSB3 bacterium]